MWYKWKISRGSRTENTNLKDPHTNHPFLEVLDSVSCTSQSVSMHHWLSHRLVCSDNFLLVTWGKGSASKYVSFPFGFWSPFCTFCSWSSTFSITTALGEADSTHIFLTFLLFLVREQMAQWQHILLWAGRWKFTYLTLNYPPDIPIPAGTPFNILNMYHLMLFTYSEAIKICLKLMEGSSE